MEAAKRFKNPCQRCCHLVVRQDQIMKSVRSMFPRTSTITMGLPGNSLKSEEFSQGWGTIPQYPGTFSQPRYQMQFAARTSTSLPCYQFECSIPRREWKALDPPFCFVFRGVCRDATLRCSMRAWAGRMTTSTTTITRGFCGSQKRYVLLLVVLYVLLAVQY